MGSEPAPLSYRSTYRRSVFALLTLPSLLLGGGLAVWTVIELADRRSLEDWVLGIAGAVLLGLVAVLLLAFRTHRWTVEAGGLRIEEGPAVPFAGLNRQRLLPFAEIVALKRVIAGADHLVEIETSSGRRHRLSRAIPRNSHVGHADAAGHEAFIAALGAALARGGGARQVGEGLSFWNRAAGLAWQVVLLAMSLAIAGVTAWALWLGAPASGTRSGQGAAIFLLLPVGAAWLLLRSWRRRREVLRRQAR